MEDAMSDFSGVVELDLDYGSPEVPADEDIRIFPLHTLVWTEWSEQADGVHLRFDAQDFQPRWWPVQTPED